MLYSQLFGKTKREAPREEESINSKLLIRAGFIDKLMSGSYTLLPLGKRVVSKIENIIREEMNNTGAQEVLMPLLHPKEIWNETGRWDAAREIMYQFKKNDKEYALSFTHEEIVLDLLRKHISSYRDFPVKVYHFSTKFRDELRPKSGILRGREFLMKDLYSAHTSSQDLDKYYWEVADAYKKVFKRIGFDAKIVEASGGVFTDQHTHEFQVLCDQGEDTIYCCEKCDFAQNKEITNVKDGDSCPKCTSKSSIIEAKSIEVGNIFRFGTVYSKKMNIMFTDEKGERKYPYFGSYGIGLTRVLGTLVELFSDERGIIWPEAVAPFKVHMIVIQNSESRIQNLGNEVYEKLQEIGIEVLYDDREEVSAGQKFADFDLIGVPYRLVISERTLRSPAGDSGQAQDKIEFKKRNEAKTELLDIDSLIKMLKG